MAVTANQMISRKDGCRKSFPVAASTTIYEGTLVYINSNGYADDDTNSGANEFAGIAIAKVDNSAGGNGALWVDVHYDGDFLLAGSGFAQTNVGDKIYGVDNADTSLSGTGNTFIGRMSQYVSSTSAWVDINDRIDPTDTSVASVADNTELYFGDGEDAAIQWATADADNHALVIAAGDSNQSVHVTDKGARDTDWNIASTTHPNVYVHSNTTPATDYLRIGGHDGTTADIDIVGGTTINIKVAGTAYMLATASGLGFIDDTGPILGTGNDAKLIWSTGDADNHSVVLALGDSNQGLHVTDLGAVATDWNIVATTHPNVYIHSNTTPATDYLRLGDHDGTEADIDVVGGTSLALKIAGTEYASVRVTGLACGTYVAAATPGTDQLTLKATGTAPSGTGANVGHLYADFETDDDELFWLSGTNGTATQLTT